MKVLTIDVTQEDIDKGIRGNCNYCPIANSVQRKLGAGVKVSVYSGSAVVYSAESGIALHSFILPGMANRFIDYFDNGAYVGPRKFRLVTEVS